MDHLIDKKPGQTAFSFCFPFGLFRKFQILKQQLWVWKNWRGKAELNSVLRLHPDTLCLEGDWKQCSSAPWWEFLNMMSF